MSTSKAKSTSTRKVGSSKAKAKPVHDDSSATAEAPEKEAKVKKPEFDLATAVAADGGSCPLDDNGRLTAVPSNWSTDYRPLGRSSFASRTLQLEHKLHLFDAETENRSNRRDELVGKIEESTVGVSPEKKKMKKAMRLKKQLEQLKAELAEQGIEL